jgi:hypothetical protein
VITATRDAIGLPAMDDRAVVALTGTTLSVAALLHLWGNPLPLSGAVSFATEVRFVTSGLMAIAALWCLARPGRTRPLDVLSGAVVVKTLVDLPFVSNHQLLLALLSACWLLARAVGGRRPTVDPTLLFVRTARWTFLVAYGFAAFAKLNTAFLDPEVSCATLLLGSLGQAWLGDGALPTGAAAAAIGATLVIELSVPVLLLIPRTRRVGIVVACLFHGGLALDPVRHFYDFSAVVLVGIALFADVGAMRWWAARFTGGRNLAGAVRAALLAVAAVLTVVLARSPGAFGIAWVLAVLLLGILTASVVVAVLVRAPGGEVETRLAVASPSLRGPAVLALIPVLLAVTVGTSPYLELRNVTTWNMYSNLRTAEGDSNHLIVRRTLPLSDALRDRVALPDMDPRDELPRLALHARLVMEGPGASVEVLDGGQERTITYEEAREDTGPIRFRLRRLGPVSVVGPEPCRLSFQA